MAISVSLQDVTADFSTLLQHIREGEEVLILEDGHELARLVPSQPVIDHEVSVPLEEAGTLAEALRGRVGTVSLDVPSNLRRKTGEIFTEIVLEKHQPLSP